MPAPISHLLPEVRRMLDYNPETGVLSWKVKPAGNVRVGQPAGCMARNGYVQLRVFGQQIKAHRVVWLWFYGVDADGQIDHINGDKRDNRIANLRVVDARGNRQNIRSAPRHSRSGLIGAHWNKRGYWQSAIQGPAGREFLGRFSTAAEASAAYIEAKRRVHQACTL